MRKIKFLTSACVIVAGFCSSVFAAPTVRAVGTPTTTSGSTVGTATRAGTLRIQNAGKSATTAAAKKTANSSESARLASLAGLGMTTKLSAPKLPSAANASAVADLRSAIEELGITVNSTANALDSVQSGLDKLTENYDQIDGKIEETKEYTDAAVDTLNTQKIVPLETSVEQVAETASKAATKTYVDQELGRVSTTAFNKQQVEQAIADKLTEENYKGYTDEKVAGVNLSVDMRVQNDEIQYKSGNATSWTKLADKSEFTGGSGADGVTPVLARDDANQRITVKYGDAEAQELLPYSVIKGPAGSDGVTPIITKDTTNKLITVKYGDNAPQELVSYADITGPAGDDGCTVGYSLDDYTVDGVVRGKTVTMTKNCNGTETSDTFVVENGIDGEDACVEITSEYRQPVMSGDKATSIGYLEITKKDNCNNYEDVYKQEDKCDLTDVDLESETPQDIYTCSKQTSDGTTYKFVKPNSSIGAKFKAVNALLDKKVNIDDVTTPQIGLSSAGDFCTCIKTTGKCADNPRDYSNAAEWECTPMSDNFQGEDGCSIDMDEPIVSGSSVTINFYKKCGQERTFLYDTTVQNGQDGADSCYSFSTTYTAPKNKSGDIYGIKGNLTLALTATGKCDGTSDKSFTYEDGCELTRLDKTSETYKDVYNCTRYDNGDTYLWSSGSSAFGSSLAARFGTSRRYIKATSATPGYVRTLQDGVETGVKEDQCESEYTRNSADTKTIARRKCVVQTLDSGISNPDNAVSGTEYYIGEDKEIPQPLPVDEYTYTYYKTANGKPGHLETKLNGTLLSDISDSDCWEEVLAATTNDRSGSLQRKCKVQTLPTGTTNNSGYTQGEAYVVADATPQPIPTPTMCDIASATAVKTVTESYTKEGKKPGVKTATYTLCDNSNKTVAVKDACTPVVDADAYCGDNQQYVSCVSQNDNSIYGACETVSGTVLEKQFVATTDLGTTLTTLGYKTQTENNDLYLAKDALTPLAARVQTLEDNSSNATICPSGYALRFAQDSASASKVNVFCTNEEPTEDVE